MRAWQLSWLLARRFRGKRERSGFVSFISAWLDVRDSPWLYGVYHWSKRDERL